VKGDGIGARVVGVHRRHGGVVGEHEPRQGTAVDVLHGAADRSGARELDVVQEGPVDRAVQAHPGYPMTGADHQQQVLVELGTVEDGHRLEHSLRVLGDEVGPRVARPRARAGDGHASARGVEVGADQDAAVPQEGQPGLRVDVALHQHEGWGFGRALREVGDPEIVARLGALTRRHLEPVAVAAHLDAVVVGHRHAGAEDEDVVVG
jgi:hypothetical protein